MDAENASEFVRLLDELIVARISPRVNRDANNIKYDLMNALITVTTVTCPACKGVGKENPQLVCGVCDGEGKIC